MEKHTEKTNGTRKAALFVMAAIMTFTLMQSQAQAESQEIIGAFRVALDNSEVVQENTYNLIMKQVINNGPVAHVDGFWVMPVDLEKIYISGLAKFVECEYGARDCTADSVAMVPLPIEDEPKYDVPEYDGPGRDVEVLPEPVIPPEYPGILFVPDDGGPGMLVPDIQDALGGMIDGYGEIGKHVSWQCDFVLGLLFGAIFSQGPLSPQDILDLAGVTKPGSGGKPGPGGKPDDGGKPGPGGEPDDGGEPGDGGDNGEGGDQTRPRDDNPDEEEIETEGIIGGDCGPIVQCFSIGMEFTTEMWDGVLNLYNLAGEAFENGDMITLYATEDDHALDINVMFPPATLGEVEGDL